MTHSPDSPFLTDAQLARELSRCEYCEEKSCREGCPAHCSPADFIMAARLMAPADIKRSAAEILKQNPLGGVCGLVCPDRFCQARCSHKGFDRPLEIPALQATVVEKAKRLGGLLPLEPTTAKTGKRIAVIGAGPAGIAAAAVLAQAGHEVDLLEREAKAGGACLIIPEHRLPRRVIETDLEWVLALTGVHLETGREIADPQALLGEGYAAVVVAVGLWKPITLGIAGEERAIAGLPYLRNPGAHKLDGKRVLVVGGGATAVDCAVTAALRGATAVEMIALEKLSEMPLTQKELAEISGHGVAVTGRARVAEIGAQGVRTIKVALPDGEAFHPSKVRDVAGTEQARPDIDVVIVAIGARPTLARIDKPGVFFAGDCDHGPSTVVEAVASGKNAGVRAIAFLAGTKAEAPETPRKSRVTIPGINRLPVPLETDFFGRRLISPFLLSAAPPSDGYKQMRAAFEAGWAGGVMKTAFDNIPIHIPADYMFAFDQETYGNCDNVSGHALERVCREIEQLRQEFPDRLVAASTGGPVSGNDENDRKGWQSNTKKLESAGVMAIEYSLSCPQGGDGSEGAIVSQNARLTAKIIDWVLQVSDPDVPKIFKLTGAVTSIEVIVKAIREVFARHPDKKAGVTLANTFPVLGFRPGSKRTWDEGVVLGMSGGGVAPISNLTLASVAHLGVNVSGNGGTMDYRSAAHFLALGCTTVQFCTAAMKYGYHYVDELHAGLSHLMASRGMRSMKDLIGCALPEPITGFMDLTPTKRISSLADPELCMSCGNCTRCSYGAISLDDQRHPVMNPEFCVGCSICTKKCFTGALAMRDRTAAELAALRES